MKILIVGAGGREHALAWRLSRDPDVSALVMAPGNPGMAALGTCIPANLANPEELLAVAERERVDLTVVGPEIPLERGLADLFRAQGRPIIGPGSQGAALECSKVHSKHFMDRHGIPTAKFIVCSKLDDALASVRGQRFGLPVVIKADGLAAGKGVVIATTLADAEAAIRAAMVDRAFGDAGGRLVIEECLTGPEVSAFYLCDGRRALPLSTAQDHKRIWDEDRGPNTGGMGAFAPSPLMTGALAEFSGRCVAQAVVDGMRAEGEPYIGFLYVSLMLAPDGPKVIEFNVRFGDPEAQVIWPGLEGRVAQTLLAAAEGRLDSLAPLGWGADKYVGVVLASRGYPATAESGRPISGLDRAAAVPQALVFHAGTAASGGQIVTAGGRVLTIVGRGASYADAMATAYRAVAEIEFDGMQFRRDIGRKAIHVD